MFDILIPKAHAQVGNVAGQVKDTAVAGGNYAVDQGEAGIQGLIKYIVTNIDNWIAGLVIIVISYVIAKMTAAAIKEAIIKKKGEEVQESALILIERMTKIAIVTIGVTIALALNGLNFTAVIGAMSLGIGFALKDILGNFISGVIMLSQDRIRIGDFIKVKDILGTIVSIDTRATILQGLDGTEVVIPNQTMLGETLISYSTNPFRRIELIVGVDYATDLPMVTSLIRGILDKDIHIVPKPDSLVLVDEFGDSSINIKILFWIESSKNWLDIRSNLANKIKHAFDDLSINIPFPIRTLKLDEDDRSFLKTMDSMKKGVVPEPGVVPSQAQMQESIIQVEKERHVPYNVFEEKKVAPKPATTPPPAPQAVPPATPKTETPATGAEPKKELVGVGATTEKKSFKVDETPKTPPPTHM